MAKVQILGSAAAEGIPAMFCNCRVCMEAWKNGGKDMRKRAAYKLNDHVRIDFGPDTLQQEFQYQLHSENLKHVFITHNHEDHIDTHLLFYRMPGFSKVDPDNILNIYGTTGVFHKIQKDFWQSFAFNGDYSKFRLNPVMINPFEPVVLEDEDMEFYALKADHMGNAPHELPVFYVFRNGSSWAMIANDTGYFREETWAFLEEKKFKFDLVISDCTGGIRDFERNHMSGTWVLETRKHLEKMGSVTANTKYFINHFSHNGQATHAELEAYYNPHGIQVCYDGLEIEY